MTKCLPLFGALFGALFFSLFCSSIALGQATVTSDKPDYAPRSTAVFTGAGFAPFETVELKVKNLSYPCNTVFADSSYLPWTVVADENGGFVTEWLVCDCPGDSLRLKATGLTSLLVAYAYFTDAGNASSGDGSMSPSPATACSGSSSNTFNFTFTSPSGKDFIAGSQLQVTVPAGWTAPTTSSGSSGFVSVAPSSGSAGSGVSVSIQSVSANVITINMTALAGKSFVLTYANVPAPAAATYTFSSSSKISGGSFAALAANSQPKITVNPAPSATISYGASPYCSTAGNIDVTRTGTSGGTYSSTSGLSINSSSGRINAGSSTPGTYTVTYTIAAANGCSEFSTTTSVTINAAPSATFSYSGTPYCANAGTASPTFSGTSGGTFSSTSGLSIDASTGQVNLGSSTAGTYTVTYTIAASGGCAQFQTTTQIRITAPPSATISYTGSPYCSDAGMVDVTLTGTTGGSFSGDAGLVINSGSGRVNTGTSTPGTHTVTYTVAAANGCSQYQTTASVTINATPRATLSGTTAICSGGTATLTITPSVGTGTFSGTLSDGTAFSGTGSSFTVNVSPTTNTTYTIATLQDDNCTAAPSGRMGSATVSINTAPVVTTDPTNQTECAGSTVTFTAAASGSPTPTVQWQVKVPAGSFTNITGETSTTLSFTADAAQNGNLYRAVFTNTCSSTNSAEASLTVNTAPVVTTDPTNQTECVGSTVTFTAAANGSPTPTVQWQVKVPAESFTNITGETNTTLTFTADATQNGNVYRAVFTNTCSSTNSAEASLTVNTAPVVTTDPTNQTECAGSTVTFTAAASGSPTPTVQWQVKVPAGSFTNITGETSTTLSFTADATQNGNLYRAVFTNTCSSTNSAEASLTVNAAPVVTTDPTNQTECDGSTVTFTAAASGSPTPTVQWQVKVPAGSFTNITGETSTTLSFTADATQHGNMYRAVFTNTCSSTNSAEASLTVNTAPVVTTDPTNQTECVGNTVTFTAAASGSPTPTVQWQVKVPAGSFTNITGETSTTLSFTADATQNGNVYRAVFTNTCSSTNSAEASLTVNTAPVVTTDPTNQTECVGSTVTFTAAASGSPTPTVQWQVKVPAGSFTNITGETSTTLSFTADATQNGNVYRSVFTNTCSSTNSAEASLTVNTAPSIIGHPASSLKCIGESATFTVVATGTGLTYKWYKSGTATALVDGGKIANATTNSLTISNITTAEAGNYYVVVSGTCSPAATSNVGKLMVKEVVVSPTGAQYSDQVKFTAKIYNGKDLLTYSPTVTFKVSSINLDGGVNIAMALDGATENIKAEVTRPLVEVPTNPSNGQMSPGAKTVLACFNNITSPVSACNAQTTLNIYREDAKVEYTGTQFITTGSSSEGNATVQLRATVQDITAVTGDALYDAFNGDIRNAKVMFVNRDASNAPISGWLTPTLINTSDVKTGTVSYNTSLAAGTTATDYTIGVVVGYNVVSSPADSMGYYKRNSGDDDIVLTVSRPLNEFITGGGYIIPSTPNGSSGLKASDAGRKVNFGFNVKYTKSNKNLQGRINVIFRRTETDGIRHVYQVKSTSLTSLAIDQSKLIANVVAKGNVVDITNPLMPVSVPGCPGNLTMNFNVVDKGEPGSLDSMSLTLWDNNKLIYSTSWSGTKTLYKVLTGGNIQVRGTSYVASTSVVDESTRETGMENSTLFKVKAYPNPSTHQFTLNVESGSNEPIEIKVFDVAGYMVYYHRGSLKEAHHRFGQMLTNGTYFVDVRQGDKRSTITLLKK